MKRRATAAWNGTLIKHAYTSEAKESVALTDGAACQSSFREVKRNGWGPTLADRVENVAAVHRHGRSDVGGGGGLSCLLCARCRARPGRKGSHRRSLEQAHKCW